MLTKRDLDDIIVQPNGRVKIPPYISEELNLEIRDGKIMDSRPLADALFELHPEKYNELTTALIKSSKLYGG